MHHDCTYDCKIMTAFNTFVKIQSRVLGLWDIQSHDSDMTKWKMLLEVTVFCDFNKPILSCPDNIVTLSTVVILMSDDAASKSIKSMLLKSLKSSSLVSFSSASSNFWLVTSKKQKLQESTRIHGVIQSAHKEVKSNGPQMEKVSPQNINSCIPDMTNRILWLFANKAHDETVLHPSTPQQQFNDVIIGKSVEILDPLENKNPD